MLSAIVWLSQFERYEQGIIVYKKIGYTDFTPPDTWEIKAGSLLTEVVNPDRGTSCGSGVNFGTLEWCKEHYTDSNSVLWKCLIRWEHCAGIVVPYNTDGKARCERLELVEIVEN
jgi:hypothetical protein